MAAGHDYGIIPVGILAMDMARGHGEHLDVLAQLIVREEDRAAFRSLAQDNFEELFPHDHTTTGEMLGALGRLMAGSSVFAHYVEG